MKVSNLASVGSALLLGAGASLCVGHQAIAAEKIVLTYGPFRQGINVSDLEAFAKKGETTATIRQILGFAKQDPERLQGLMTLEIGLNPRTLARVIYSNTGEKLTDEIGKTIRTQRRIEGGKAIRAALMLAASDGKVSVLDILKKYPLRQVYVDVASIGATVEKVQGLAGNLQSLLQEATSSSSATSVAPQTTRTETRTQTRTQVQPAAPPAPRRMTAPAPTVAPAAPRRTTPVRGLW